MLTTAAQHFSAGHALTAALASAASIGFLASPFMVRFAARRGWRVSGAGARLLLVAALGFALAAAVPALWAFALGFGVAVAALSLVVPFSIALWRQNLDDAVRGHRFSVVIQNEVFAGLAASLLVAWWLGTDAGRYRLPVGIAAVLAAVAALCLRRAPGRPLPMPIGGNPYGALAWLWRDRGFGWVNLSYTIMGFANFMVFPVRQVFLAAADGGGLGLRPDVIQILLVTVPTLMRLCFGRLWGRAFDRLNFVAVRLAINGCFALGTAFCFTDSLALQTMASLCLGLAFAGGDIAWSLWVTKYAPPERTADYMAVHTFLTGVRGLLGPAVGFACIAAFSAPVLALIAFALYAVASSLLVPEIKRFRVPAAAE